MIKAISGVRITEVYQHKKSGRFYKVLDFFNFSTTDEDKFPVTVAYLDVQNPDLRWCRPLKDFIKAFKVPTQ